MIKAHNKRLYYSFATFKKIKKNKKLSIKIGSWFNLVANSPILVIPKNWKG